MLHRTTTAALLALALIAAACSTGGTPQAQGPSVAALTPTSIASSVATAQPDGDATSEGIQVYGHWTIEVRNPDGSVDQLVEFENALMPQGKDTLIRMLDSRNSPGQWDIHFNDSTSPCIDFNCIVAHTVYIYDPATSLAHTLRLSGSYTSDRDFTLDEVATRLGVCGGNWAPTDCDLDFPLGDFTNKAISPVPVKDHQTVYVEVDISFS